MSSGRVWCGRVRWGPDAQKGPYGRLFDVVWRRCFGLIPPDLDVGHVCNVTLCQRPDRLQLLTKGDKVKRRGPTRGQPRGS